MRAAARRTSVCVQALYAAAPVSVSCLLLDGAPLRYTSQAFPGVVMAYQNIILEHAEPGIYVLTVNRPQALNALNGATLDELAHASKRIAADASARALLITGAG